MIETTGTIPRRERVPALGRKVQERQSAEASADALAWKRVHGCHLRVSVKTDSGMTPNVYASTHRDREGR